MLKGLKMDLILKKKTFQNITIYIYCWFFFYIKGVDHGDVQRMKSKLKCKLPQRLVVRRLKADLHSLE